MKIKVCYSNDDSNFEERVNNAIKELEDKNYQVIDIKYNSTIQGAITVFHTAMIMYKPL